LSPSKFSCWFIYFRTFNVEFEACLHFRNVGIGVCSSFARVGAILSPVIAMLSEVSEALPYVVFGVMSLIGGKNCYRIFSNWRIIKTCDIKVIIRLTSVFTKKYSLTKNSYCKKKLKTITDRSILACLHDQNKGGFLEGRLLSSQSKQSEKLKKPAL